MGDKHTVRFEPVGIEIEVDEDETILEAAFRQGVTLMHGCKEGQCSACKSFLLEGEDDDVELDRYSTFALPDFERDDGLVLLCRCHAYEDLAIELLNFDEDMLRSGVPIQSAVAEVVANERVTHDIRRLALALIDPPEMMFIAGQYVDIFIPGTGSSRSFSMANTPSTDDRLEFLIRIYPDGVFSGFLDTRIQVGDRLDVKGPYGVFTLRERDADLLFIGGGAGMAPILSLLRSMDERALDRRAVYYYGARTRDDLLYEEELHELEARLPRFRYLPALSEPEEGDGWGGETGLITDVVDRREGSLSGFDAYVCGPPPMVDAAIAMLAQHGVPEGRIFYDKFTTTGDPDGH